MNNSLRFVYLITLLTTGLVAGVFFSEYIGLVPVLYAQNAVEYVHFKQAIIHSYNPAMPILGIGGSLFYIVWLVMIRRFRSSRMFSFGLAGFIFLVVSTLVTIIGELPTNQKILALSATQPAETWTMFRDSSHTVISIRTALMLISFVLLCIASSYPPEKRELQGL